MLKSDPDWLGLPTGGTVVSANQEWSFATFLDAYGDGLATQQQYDQIAAANQSDPTSVALAQGDLATLFANPSTGTAATVGTETNPYATVTIALVLDRADPSMADTLLESDWGARQAMIAELNGEGKLWDKFGADRRTYDGVVADLNTLLGTNLADSSSNNGQISDARDRTIWLTLNPSQFQALFNQPLLKIESTGVGSSPTPSITHGWTGQLSLPTELQGVIKGIWLEEDGSIPNPVVHGNAATLTNPLGTGNSAPDADQVVVNPSGVARAYNFPDLAGAETPAIALVEPDTISAASEAGLVKGYKAYRRHVGGAVADDDKFKVVSTADPLVPFTANDMDELALDVSVVAGAAPESAQLLYGAGSVFQIYQQAIFDSHNQAAVLSSSDGAVGRPSKDSPFQWAFQQLFVDAMVANMSVHIAAGDLGSSGNVANGAANVNNTLSPTWALAVGGTSLSTYATAATDPSLASEFSDANNNDRNALWRLAASGLKLLPSAMRKTNKTHDPQHPVSRLQAMFETTWNKYGVSETNTILFGQNRTGSGGVNTSLPTPAYQSDFGLVSIGGRGSPDVSALSGGNDWYGALNPSFITGQSTDLFTEAAGTSAATPLWASLTATFDAVFADQGLPQLGFYNDLLYTAAAVAPASFNDVTLGNNNSSYYVSPTGQYNDSNPNNGSSYNIVATDRGYEAGPGYDFATGLGTPNGVLLGRALTAIATSEYYFFLEPKLLGSDGKSGVNQTVMLQGSASTLTPIEVTAGSTTIDFSTSAAGTFAWTDRFAQQVMQKDFSPKLLKQFDHQNQGLVSQDLLSQGDLVSVSIDGDAASADQAKLTSPFGFADFATASAPDSAVRVARPVMVAETAGGQDDQTAIVRLRDLGKDSLSLMFYKVDDYNGTVAGLAPGSVGYEAAAVNAAYTVGGSGGGTTIANPARGQYSEATLIGVDAGDLIAMELVDNSKGKTYWGFTQGNETVHQQQVAHLWNYGLNTFGWEETFRGGDRDFNDLVVQVDFTSASGHGYLK